MTPTGKYQNCIFLISLSNFNFASVKRSLEDIISTANNTNLVFQKKRVTLILNILISMASLGNHKSQEICPKSISDGNEFMQ